LECLLYLKYSFDNQNVQLFSFAKLEKFIFFETVAKTQILLFKANN